MIDHGVWGEEKSAACDGGEEETRTGGVVHRQVTVPGPGDYKTVIYLGIFFIHGVNVRGKP